MKRLNKTYFYFNYIIFSNLIYIISNALAYILTLGRAYLIFFKINLKYILLRFIYIYFILALKYSSKYYTHIQKGKINNKKITIAWLLLYLR